jgi:uncharacterized membrane protein (DUF2068 family)
VDWSLLYCGLAGHVTYAPDEPGVREQLSASTSAGQSWRCLRCGTFVPGPAKGSGPAADGPVVRRDKELRGALILRLFAIERFLRCVAVALLTLLVWRLEYSRQSIEAAFDREVPILRELFQQFGYNIANSKLVGLVHQALALSPGTIRVLTIALAVYAVIELCEGTGLWLARRWGEYFAMVATSIGIPFEIYDLTLGITVTRVILFTINLVLVAYLVFAKRLFGVRGGRRAHEARMRSESLLQTAIAAAAAAADPEAAGEAAAPVGSEPAEQPAADAPANTPAAPATAANTAAAATSNTSAASTAAANTATANT